MIADKRYDKMSKHMVELAYRAWEELMVEKMKKAYEDTRFFVLPGFRPCAYCFSPAIPIMR